MVVHRYLERRLVRGDFPTDGQLSQVGVGARWLCPGPCLVSGRPLLLPTTKEITATGGKWSIGEGLAKVPGGWGTGEEWEGSRWESDSYSSRCDQP